MHLGYMSGFTQVEPELFLEVYFIIHSHFVVPLSYLIAVKLDILVKIINIMNFDNFGICHVQEVPRDMEVHFPGLNSIA